ERDRAVRRGPAGAPRARRAPPAATARSGQRRALPWPKGVVEDPGADLLPLLVAGPDGRREVNAGEDARGAVLARRLGEAPEVPRDPRGGGAAGHREGDEVGAEEPLHRGGR